MASRKPKVAPECVALDDMTDQFAQLFKIRKLIAKHGAAEKLIINAIKARLGDSARGTIDGTDVVVWGRSVRTQVDIPVLKEKYPDVADACVKLVEVRSFKILDKP